MYTATGFVSALYNFRYIAKNVSTDDEESKDNIENREQFQKVLPSGLRVDDEGAGQGNDAAAAADGDDTYHDDDIAVDDDVDSCQRK